MRNVAILESSAVSLVAMHGGIESPSVGVFSGLRPYAVQDQAHRRARPTQGLLSFLPGRTPHDSKGLKCGRTEEKRDVVCQQWPVQFRKIHGAGRIDTPGDL